MDARTLASKLNYVGMEKSLRAILLKSRMVEADELATMTCLECCDKFLEDFEIVAVENESIKAVHKCDYDKYKNMVYELSR